MIGGIAVGASSVVGPMYISEISPAPVRGQTYRNVSVEYCHWYFSGFSDQFRIPANRSGILALDGRDYGSTRRTLRPFTSDHSGKSALADFK